MSAYHHKSKNPLDDTKMKIFLVAADLFSEKGYQRVSMREISECSGVSKPTIYYYFGSKENIYTELARTGLDETIRFFKGHLQQKTLVRDRLKELLKGIVWHFENHLSIAKFMSTIFEENKEAPFLKAVRNDALALTKLLHETFDEGKKSGEIRNDIPTDIMVDILGATIYSMIVRQRSKNVKLEPNYSEIIINAIFSGIGKTPKEQTQGKMDIKEEMNVHSQNIN
ncbi:TetR/AcrR family transcriptional regulator [bacterium]|nr:TetR/AcrR family transcriptional regulator [bacterium]